MNYPLLEKVFRFCHKENIPVEWNALNSISIGGGKIIIRKVDTRLYEFEMNKKTMTISHSRYQELIEKIRRTINNDK